MIKKKKYHKLGAYLLGKLLPSYLTDPVTPNCGLVAVPVRDLPTTPCGSPALSLPHANV